MAKKQKINNKDDDQGGQAVNPRLVCLDIDQIHLYDRNPRTVRNPEYERIKHSIANHGLEQPLIITRRPGDEDYIVKAGGNTRLQILKDLYEVTRDPCYAVANCIEVGWKDESTVLLGHLRENSLRGELTFVDQAAAVCAYAEMLAEEQGVERVTLKDLQAALRNNGLPTSDGTLSRMRYAAEFLMLAMPLALSDGLGHRFVGTISKLHRSAAQLWVRRGLGSEDEFDAVFAELCRRHDGPDWQFEPLRRAVEVELAEAGDISIQTIRMSMDTSRLAALVPPEDINPITILETRENAQLPSHDINPESEGGSQADDESYEDRMLTVSVDLDDGKEEDSGRSTHVQDRPFVDLRRRAFGLAKSLASGFRLGDLIVPLPDCGNGFLLTDLPDAAVLERIDGDSRATIGTMWWQLFAFSETACAPMGIIQKRLPPESALRQVLEDQNVEFLFDRIEVIGAAHFAERFWARLPKREWQDWLYLAHTHRESRQKVIEMERPLWPREA